MSDSQDKNSRGWRGVPVWIVVVFLLVLVVGVASMVAWQRMRKQQFSIDVTPEIRLDFVTILTHKNPELDTKTWQERLFDKLPSAIQSQVLHYYKPPRGAKLMTNVSEQELVFCFLVKYPDDWKTIDVEKVRRTKINPAVNVSGLKGMRLNYGDGWYSGRTAFPGWSTSWSGPGEKGILYEVRARDVPATAREFEFELVGSVDGPPMPLRSVTFQNPLYEKVVPVTRRDALPTMVTLSGIDVTLTALGSKAAEIGHSLKSRQFPWLEEMQKTGRFFRAAGTPDDPNWCNVLIDIAEDGRAAPWSVRSVEFYYGIDEREFTTSQRRHEDLSNKARNRDFFQFFPDVGMVQQPVKLEVMLDHNADFGLDEMATIDLDLPTTGAASRLVPVSGLWSGPCDVCIGNAGDWEIRSKYGIEVSGPVGALTIAVRGMAQSYRIVGGILKGEGGRQIDVLERVTAESRSKDLTTFGFQYDDSRIAWKNLPPVDLTDFSTMSLTVASPKSLGPFVFYAEPGLAEIPVGGE